MSPDGRPAGSDETWPIVNAESPCPKGLTRRVSTEPEVIIPLVGSVPSQHGKRTEWAYSDASDCLALRRHHGHDVIVRSTDKHMPRPDSKILSAINSHPRAPDKDNVVNPLKSATLLRGRTDRPRTVRVPNRCQVRITVFVRRSQTGRKFP